MQRFQRARKSHIFTLVQMLCFAVCCAAKEAMCVRVIHLHHNEPLPRDHTKKIVGGGDETFFPLHHFHWLARALSLARFPSLCRCRRACTMYVSLYTRSDVVFYTNIKLNSIWQWKERASEHLCDYLLCFRAAAPFTAVSVSRAREYKSLFRDSRWYTVGESMAWQMWMIFSE